MSNAVSGPISSVAGPAPAENFPSWLKLTRSQFWALLWAGLIWWHLSWIPLAASGPWTHLRYGRWIWSHGRLPATELFAPLAEGMPYVDHEWLSQLAFYAAYAIGGSEGLSLLYSLAAAATTLLLLKTIHDSIGRLWLSLLALVSLRQLVWTYLVYLRPQLFATVLFVVLLTIVLRARWRAVYWVAVPALLALWANVHGSFPVGLAVLGCCTVGEVVDSWRRARCMSSVVADGRVHRWLLLTELSAAACLLNPYGTDLYRSVLQFGRNVNLQGVLEWQPLQPLGQPLSLGIAFTASVVVVVVLLRLSGRRVRGAEACLMLFFGLFGLRYVRCALWWGLLIPFAVLPHLGVLLQRWWPVRPRATAASFKNTFLTVAGLWICFAVSPLGMAMLHGHHRRPDQVVARNVPFETARYLREHPPEGLVFLPYEWADWLTWSGPPSLRSISSYQVHLLPAEVWAAYNRVVGMIGNWEEELDRLGARTLVVDKQRQEALFQAVQTSSGWRIVHQDEQAAVAVRRGRGQPG